MPTTEFLAGICCTVLGLSAWPTTAWAQAEGIQKTNSAVISDRYSGGFQYVFPQELDLVRSYASTLQPEIAAQLGLPNSRGFEHPVLVRFTDGAPALSENPYFYVVAKSSGTAFVQEIVGNVDAFARRSRKPDPGFRDFQGGFRYALAKAMLNDLAAGKGDTTPLWFQEGVAVYAAGNGDALLRSVVHEALEEHEDEGFEGELDSPGPFLSHRDLAQYYLAVNYIASLGSLRSFVSHIVSGDSELDATIHTFGFDWPTLQAKIRVYSAHIWEMAIQQHSPTVPSQSTYYPAR